MRWLRLSLRRRFSLQWRSIYGCWWESINNGFRRRVTKVKRTTKLEIPKYVAPKLRAVIAFRWSIIESPSTLYPGSKIWNKWKMPLSGTTWSSVGSSATVYFGTWTYWRSIFADRFCCKPWYWIKRYCSNCKSNAIAFQYFVQIYSAVQFFSSFFWVLIALVGRKY